MMNRPEPPSASMWNWLWLALAMVLVMFASGRWAFAPAAVLAPVFALRFARSQPTWRGYGVLTLCSLAPIAVSWSVFPFGGKIGFGIFCVAASVFGNLPYLLDRWLSPRVGWRRTLPFPLAAVALEALSTGGELGSWGASGYSQIGVLPIAQLASVTGLPGFAFVTAWLAALLNGAWEAQSPKRRGLFLSVACAAMLIPLGAGSFRLFTAPQTDSTVRLAAIATPRLRVFPNAAVRARWRAGQPLAEADRAAIDTASGDRIEDLLARSTDAANQGAALVAWSEGAAVITDARKEAIVERLRTWSSEHGAVLAATLLVLPTDGTTKWDNLLLFIDGGEVALSYRKAKPTPGAESAWSLRGDGTMLVHETAWGRIGGAICYDADFPGLIAQASRQRVDLLVIPAGDWPAVASMHARMAQMRAIEQGVAVLRSAAAGQLTAVSPTGEVLASAEQRGSELSVLVADVPVQWVPTVYGRVGDVLAYASGIVLAAWAVWAIGAALLGRLRKRKTMT